MHSCSVYNIDARRISEQPFVEDDYFSSSTANLSDTQASIDTVSSGSTVLGGMVTQGFLPHNHHQSSTTATGLPRCRHIVIDALLLFLTVVLVAGQLAFYDLFFMAYGDEHLQKIFQHESKLILSLEEIIDEKEGFEQQQQLVDLGIQTGTQQQIEAPISWEDWEKNCTAIVENEQRDLEWRYVFYFIGPDLIAIAAMAMLPVMAIWRRRQNQKKKHEKDEECGRALSNIRHASFSWFVYAFVLDVKIVISSRGFVRVLQYLEKCHNDVIVGVNAFVLMLCGSSLIFLTLVLSHHAHTREAKDFLHRVAENITFDILDGVHFYSIIFSPGSIDFLIEHPLIEYMIIGLVCVNFALPGVTLLKLFHKLSKSEIKQRRTRLKHLTEDVIHVLLFLCFINVPYFIIRCYLWRLMQLELSVFLLKNAVMIVIELRQLWIYSHRIAKFKTVHDCCCSGQRPAAVNSATEKSLSEAAQISATAPFQSNISSWRQRKVSC